MTPKFNRQRVNILGEIHLRYYFKRHISIPDWDNCEK